MDNETILTEITKRMQEHKEQADFLRIGAAKHDAIWEALERLHSWIRTEAGAENRKS